MFGQWKNLNPRERTYVVTALLCLLLMPVWFVCIFILPSYTSLPVGKIAVWLNRICVVMIPLMLGLADWRTQRIRSWAELGGAALIAAFSVIRAVGRLL
jgi:hypothetical protein